MLPCCHTTPAAAAAPPATSWPSTSSPAAPWHLPQPPCSHQHRHYHRPAYSAVCGRPKPEPWPVITKVKAPDQLKWHRTVMRLPPGVQAMQEGGKLILSGKAGTVTVDLAALDPSGLVAFRLLQAGSAAGTPQAPPSPAAPPPPPSQAAAQQDPATSAALILASPDKDQFAAVVSSLEGSVQGVMQGYLVGLTVKGVGYRLEPVEGPVTSQKTYWEKANYEKSTVTYPYSKPVSAVRLKVGFSRTVVYPLPPDVRAFCLKPTLLYLYGLQLPRLQQVCVAS